MTDNQWFRRPLSKHWTRVHQANLHPIGNTKWQNIILNFGNLGKMARLKTGRSPTRGLPQRRNENVRCGSEWSFLRSSSVLSQILWSRDNVRLCRKCMWHWVLVDIWRYKTESRRRGWGDDSAWMNVWDVIRVNWGTRSGDHIVVRV